MGSLLAVSLLAKLISTFTVRKMVKEAAEIQKSNHKLMKLVKAKFEHASLVSDRVQNVGAFVDKYMYEYKICGIRLNTWRSIPKKGLFVILILGIFTICENIRLEGFTETTVMYLQWTSIFVLLLSLVQFVSNEKAGLQATRNYMIEYLENVCIHRYEKKHRVTEEEQPKEVEATLAQMQEPVEEVIQKPEEQKISEEEEKSQQEIRIRAILEEFLA